MIPVDANVPCDARARASAHFRVRRRRTGGLTAGCRCSARLCPTAAPTTRSTSAIRDGDDYPRITGARGPRLPDGRQSRPQRRQPLRRAPSRAWAGRCRGRISAAAPSSSPSASTAAPPTGTRSAGSPRCAAAAPAPRSIRPSAPPAKAAGAGDRAAVSRDRPDVAVEQAGPIEFRDPRRPPRAEAGQRLDRRWSSPSLGVIVLAQPLLLIFAGIVLASMLDGGTRLLGRVLPIGRGWRLAIVTLAGSASSSGPSISPAPSSSPRPSGCARRSPSRSTGSSPGPTRWAWSRAASTSEQLERPADGHARPARLGGVERAWARSPALVMILVIGIFIAIEPRLYQRGVAWMLPLRQPRPLLPHRRADGLTSCAG